jgi:hypothetical protein
MCTGNLGDVQVRMAPISLAYSSPAQVPCGTDQSVTACRMFFTPRFQVREVRIFHLHENLLSCRKNKIQV